jgi:transposase
VRVVLEADAPRVNCPTHGPTVVAVPWARHHAGHTLAFDDTVAWLAVAWLENRGVRTDAHRLAHRGRDRGPRVGLHRKRVDRFAGLRRIGIDEISYKRHHKYLTVVVDHDGGRLVWAAPGRDTATLRRFFDALGSERFAQITDVSGAADWISDVVTERCPAAIRCADPFHVVAWATEGRPLCAVEEPRRPYRTPECQAGLDRQDRYSAVSHLSTQRGPAACVFGHGKEGAQAPDRWISWAGAAASRYSSSWPAASYDTARPSTPPSITVSPKD